MQSTEGARQWGELCSNAWGSREVQGVYGVLMGAGTGLCKTKGTESRDMVPMMYFSLWGPGGAVTCLLLL